MSGKDKKKEPIQILLVDDIAETRESIKKLLAFEQDFEVVGSAGNGREGLEMARELEPDIIIMDINMPDMDGLEAANRVTKSVPTAGVIMMSVQDDPDYMQKAMLAGARFFLSKPVNMDQLYSTIRNVYSQYEPIRRRVEEMGDMAARPIIDDDDKKVRAVGDRAGHVIAVYSPQGGAGKTTIATNLASGLMKEGIKTLLIDSDLEFGDVTTFLNLRSQSTLTDVTTHVDDMDIDFFENVVMTHDSGLNVVLGPSTPALGADIRTERPESVSKVISNIRGFYDFIVVDLPSTLDNVTQSVLEMADKIVLITLPTLPSIKNTRSILDLFDQVGFETDKTVLVINKAVENPNRNQQKSVVSPQRIQDHLKRPVEGLIPAVDEMLILNAVNRGVPVIASERDTGRTPIKQMLQFSDHMYATLMGIEDLEIMESEQPKEKRSAWGGIFGNR